MGCCRLGEFQGGDYVGVGPWGTLTGKALENGVGLRGIDNKEVGLQSLTVSWEKPKAKAVGGCSLDSS